MGNCSLRAVADAAAQDDALLTPPPTTGVVNHKNGVWKVKLVIDPRDLERILSEGVKTEVLIDQMRFAANSTPKKGIKSSWGRTVSYKFADQTRLPGEGY